MENRLLRDRARMFVCLGIFLYASSCLPAHIFRMLLRLSLGSSLLSFVIHLAAFWCADWTFQWISDFRMTSNHWNEHEHILFLIHYSCQSHQYTGSGKNNTTANPLKNSYMRRQQKTQKIKQKYSLSFHTYMLKMKFFFRPRPIRIPDSQSILQT